MESMKSEKTYKLKHSEVAIRINDYNPLLLLLGKANIDVQLICEALAENVVV